MAHAPAAGESAALRGYRWQYDHIAALVYNALIGPDSFDLRLTDPDAGQVDDLVLVRRGRTDAYQFKSVQFGGSITFNQVVRDRRTRSGNWAPSLVRSLAKGWEGLRSREHNVHVHLVTNQLASNNDHLSDETGCDKPTPDHFSAFLDRVLRPIRSGEIAVGDVPVGWDPAVARLRQASGLVHQAFGSFLQALHFDVNAGSGIPPPPSDRREDIIALSDALWRRASEASNVVELDRNGVLDLIGWRGRILLHSPHEFPVDLDTYSPLADAINALNELIHRRDTGYIAVVGPPGAGKSSLLSQALTGSTDRIVRYYAYVPRTAPARTRLTARSFLHDVVLMLNETGLQAREVRLASNDVDQLRQHLAEQFDAANQEFSRTQRRTIVVVDGLDHVHRDYRGNDSLLDELLRVDELPDGVLFIVGSRTTEPLRADVRQHVEEQEAIIDLQYHRLSSASVLEICRRAPVTAHLPAEVHEQVAQLSDGHPLALSYLLNRLRGADEEVASEVLAAAPAYAGDVAAEYRAVWDDVEDDDDIWEILSVCSRLRIGFTTEWLESWAAPAAVRKFRKKLLYLFREHHGGLRFFHDSFRQFAAHRTALDDHGDPDADADARAHRRVAELCAATDVQEIAAEQLYHRYCAGQDEVVLELAEQQTFRDQYRWLRSPALIREDATLALGVAAGRADVRIMLSLLLALVETGERNVALESVNMPGLLHDSGLIDEAISYCAVENQHVPLAHVYDLAARLGAANDPAGRRLFDSVEHNGFDDSDRAGISGEENEAAVAWTRAAALFRPLPIVIGTIQKLVQRPLEEDRDNGYAHNELWSRYAEMMEALIDWAALRHDASALETIDSTLGSHAAHLIESSPQAEDADGDVGIATVIDLRVHAHSVLLGLAKTAELAKLRIKALLSTLPGLRLFASTILDAAELLASHGVLDEAARLLDRNEYGKALTANALSSVGEVDTLDSRFRYWRLRYLLASSDGDVPESTPPSPDTPAGDGAAREAPVHSDVEAIELAARIDVAIRTLGRLDAAITAGQAPTEMDAWAVLVPVIALCQIPANRGSTTLRGIIRQKPRLMRITVGVALNYRNGLPQRFSDALATLLQEQGVRWPLKLRLDLAESLRSAGASVPWYRETLVRQEADAADEEVHSRLDTVADLIRRYARNGEKETAQRLVLTLIRMAFGVGSREDYQFDSWVAWLGRAIAEPDGDRLVGEASWLARVLTAIEPTTEGAPRSAAVNLPAAVVPADPMAAVRIFEYLVRHGTVDHLDALAALVRALVTHAAPEGMMPIELAADIVGELLAPAANKAYPDLAAGLVAAAERAAGRTNARALAEAVASSTDSYALPTTRTGWRRGLGFLTSGGEPEEEDGPPVNEDYRALMLSDGQRIAPVDVASHIQTVDDIITLRRAEAPDSMFSWIELINQRQFSIDDLRKLAEVFRHGSEREHEVLASLAEAAERKGDSETALRLACDVIRNASGEAWASSYGGARRRAFAVTVRLGDEDARVAACQDLARQVAGSRWFVSMLRSDLNDMVGALDPNVDAGSIWPEIRTYLDGVAETIDPAGSDPLADHGCRWWLLEPTIDRRASSDESDSATAIAELAVGHLSHPTWLIRDAASVIVVKALLAGSDNVVEALARFAQVGASDDTLERAGRCLAAARDRDGYAVPVGLQSLEHILASHTSQVVRDLAGERPVTVYRPLSPMYALEIPAPIEALIDSDLVFPYPFDLQYRILAEGLNLDPDTVLGVAARYMSSAIEMLPDQKTILPTLQSTRTRHVYPYEELAASRAAFGRVLADLAEAGLLDDAPPHVQRLLRTCDIELVGRRPSGRPNVVASPPTVGRHLEINEWQVGIENRLEEYIAASTNPDRVLIGAKSRLRVLNWGHLEEELVCGTTVGTGQPLAGCIFARRRSMTLRDLVKTSERRRPETGDPLLVENLALTFHQIHSDWLAFPPELAATLEWTPDPSRPGCWYTKADDLAVEPIWWVDGWWGREGPVVNDTEAIGHAVLLTLPGLADVAGAFGETTRHFELTRRGWDNDVEVDPVSATHSLAVLVTSGSS